MDITESPQIRGKWQICTSWDGKVELTIKEDPVQTPDTVSLNYEQVIELVKALLTATVAPPNEVVAENEIGTEMG